VMLFVRPGDNLYPHPRSVKLFPFSFSPSVLLCTRLIVTSTSV
jgi:hypothetical protein